MEKPLQYSTYIEFITGDKVVEDIRKKADETQSSQEPSNADRPFAPNAVNLLEEVSSVTTAEPL